MESEREREREGNKCEQQRASTRERGRERTLVQRMTALVPPGGAVNRTSISACIPLVRRRQPAGLLGAGPNLILVGHHSDSVGQPCGIRSQQACGPVGLSRVVTRRSVGLASSRVRAALRLGFCAAPSARASSWLRSGTTDRIGKRVARQPPRLRCVSEQHSVCGVPCVVREPRQGLRGPRLAIGWRARA